MSMRKPLTSGVSWWRLLRPQPQLQPMRASYQSLPMTPTILEKYLNFSRGIHMHSEASLPGTNLTQSAVDSCYESSGCETEAPSDIKTDVKVADSNMMKNLKVSERHDLAMVFTCKVCDQRSVKTCSRESYEKGVVVVRCGGCNNMHLIADRLGWFGESGSIEDLLAARGESVKKGTVDSLNLTLEDLVGKKI